MTSPINNLGVAGLAQTATRGPAQKLDDKERASLVARAPADDQVQVGEASRQAMLEPEFDRAKVEQIREQIQNGTYVIDPKRIAESFMALESMLGSSGRQEP